MILLFISSSLSFQERWQLAESPEQPKGGGLKRTQTSSPASEQPSEGWASGCSVCVWEETTLSHIVFRLSLSEMTIRCFVDVSVSQQHFSRKQRKDSRGRNLAFESDVAGLGSLVVLLLPPVVPRISQVIKQQFLPAAWSPATLQLRVILPLLC